MFKRFYSNLSLRLKTAIQMLDTADCIADIGCDHGKTAFSLIETEKAKHVIASDLSEYSLRKTEILSSRGQYEGKITCRVSNGFGKISVGEVDEALILGMGGELICSILNNGDEVARSLHCIVMQPMRGEAELREYLYKNNYRITDERVVIERDKTYQLIRAESGEPQPLPEYWPKGFYQFGPVAFERGDKNLYKLMVRYAGIMRGKINAVRTVRRDPPQFLADEVANTEHLITLFRERFGEPSPNEE